ncbi:MAG TPA: ABC transporter ATP-binding protein [Candidatus Dojkabacteria bacterium]|nr:ABC transporter ATP-binding protein [Candidatus Dojkabacteria bacterium]
MILNPTLKTLPLLKDEKSDSVFTLIKYLKWVLGLNFKLLPWVVTIRTLYIFYFNIEPIIHGYIWGKVIDALISRESSLISNYLIVYLIIIAFSFVLSAVGDRIDMYGKSTSMYKYRVYFSTIIASLGIPSLENPQISNKIYRLNESYNDLWSLTQKVSNLVSSSVSVLVSLSLVLKAHWLFAAAIFVIVLARAYVHGKELKEDWKFTTSNTENRRISEGYISSLIRIDHLKEVLQTNSFNFFMKKYQKFSNWYYSIIAKMRLRKGLFDAGFEILFVIVLGFLITYFIRQYLDEKISIGEITFYVATFRSYISSLKSFLAGFVVVGEAKERVKDAYEISQVDSVKDVNRVVALDSKNIDILIDNINFTYPESKREVISQLSLEIKQGEKIAIVGENGAGKTTLMNLLLGFYPLNSGSIKVNGDDLSTIELGSWYKHVGMLMQSFNHYDYLSLEENITLGVKDENRLNKMMKMFGVSDFASKYEFGKKQMLGSRYSNGITPSGGQWQKIAMARTLYRNTPVVVLDEPTSALDPVSEAEIFENLFEELNGKTVIIISHRFSTVKKADRIIVMKEGRIVEEGSHAKLMKLDGVYAKSYRLQADSYRD